MAKIIYITRGLHDGGGTERVTSFIASGLAERGYEIIIVCIEKGGEPYFSLSPKVHVRYLCDIASGGRVRRLKSLYAEERPDLIVMVGTNRAYFNVAAAGEIPLVGWEHFNTTTQSHPLHNASRRLAASKGWIITLTHEDAAAYEKRFKAEHVAVIPNPLTVEGLHRSPGEHGYVLSVGRLKSQKGFDRLIAAWSQVMKVYPEWRLRIVGSGAKLSSLERQIARLGLEEKIEMIPHTKDIAPYFAEADIFALTSRYEGFGLVLLEAASAGIPSVAFDVPRGPKELLKESKAGLVIENGNISDFAFALMKLIANPELREKMGYNALKKAAEYTPKNILDRWEEFISKVLSSPRSNEGKEEKFLPEK